MFGHGAYLGPDYTADYLRRSASLVRRSYGGAGSDSASRRTVADFRTNRYESQSGTLTFTNAQADAFRRLVSYYGGFFFRFHQRAWACAEGDYRPAGGASADRVLRLDGVGGIGRAARSQLLVHEQLAARAAGWKQAYRQRDRVVGAVVDRAARWHRRLVCGLWPVGAATRLARPRAGDAGGSARQATWRSPPAQRATAWFFFVMAALFLIQTLAGAASQHYRAEIDNFFGLRPRTGVPVQPDAGPGTCSSPSSGSRPRSWRPASSWPR